MKRHLQKELENLKKRILSLGAMAEERVRMSIRAFETRDGALARQIIESDGEIDAAEVEVEEECLKIIALHSLLPWICGLSYCYQDQQRPGAGWVMKRSTSRAGGEHIQTPAPFGAIRVFHHGGKN